MASPSDDQPGEYESFEISQIRTVRCNLLAVCRMCIKSLVDKSSFDTITDECPHLSRFCVLMEHILTHRIQSRWALFGSGEEIDFWEVIHRCAHPATITSVNDMENILSDLGRGYHGNLPGAVFQGVYMGCLKPLRRYGLKVKDKFQCHTKLRKESMKSEGRAWIRLALVQKKLSSFMYKVISRQDVLKSVYMSNAFILSEELTELAGNLRCLDAIDFNLCLKGQDFDMGLKQEIQYAPYLIFRQSRSSIMDDTVEEHKLLAQHSDKARLRELAGDEWVEGEVDEFVSKEVNLQSCDELREVIKTERDQKNYFEELVSVRDNQVSRLNSELAAMTAENEAQKKNFEAIILELQMELSKLQTEVREYQSKGESQAKDQNQSVTSPTKRASAFFSSLLGD